MELLILPAGLTLGQRVRLNRIALRWRQVDLAAIAGVQQHEVSGLELDRRAHPNSVQKILQALGMGDSDV